MSDGDSGSNDQVHLDAIERELGAVDELHPAKVRLTLAKCILLGIAVAILLSSWALLCGPSDRTEQAKEIFEFVKSVGPPIITLVIGFYFRSEGTRE